MMRSSGNHRGDQNENWAKTSWVFTCGTEIEGIKDKMLSKKILSEQQYHPLGLQKKDKEEILLRKSEKIESD